MAAKPTNDVWEADYCRHDLCSSPSDVPGSYIISFAPDHTLATHFAFLGREFVVELWEGKGYIAGLDNEPFRAVRSDPGVWLVEDDPSGDLVSGQYQALYYPYEEYRVPNIYLIAFRWGHSLEKHFAFVGREFDVTTLDEGYFATLEDELFQLVRSDPGVKFIETIPTVSWTDGSTSATS